MFLLKAAIRRYLLIFGMGFLPFSTLRVWVLRLCGVNVGEGCYVGFNVSVDTNYPELITIGNRVTISHDVVIITHTATPANSDLSRLYNENKPVVIGDGAWLGVRSIVLPGISIGQNCFVGAGSVVSTNTTNNSLWAGNPCILKKSLE